MPYKIVQTKEDGKDFVTIVPSRWEKDGMLKWPPKKDGKARELYQKLMKNADSSAPDGWNSVKCRLKREFETYAQAKLEWKSMSDKSDTSDTDVMPPPYTHKIPSKRKVKNRETIGRNQPNDYTGIVRCKFKLIGSVSRVSNEFYFLSSD